MRKAFQREDKYGRLRRRRRRRRRRGAALFVVLTLAFVALLFVLQAPEAVRRAMHPLHYEGEIRAAAAEFGVQPTFVAAVIYTESRFGPKVESSRGAYGLMQLLPVTAGFISEKGGVDGDYRDPETNIRMGTWYLAYLLHNRYHGDERLALAAYNSGEARVDGWNAEKGFDVTRDIPFAETHDFVENVLEAQKVYEELYGRNLDRRPGWFFDTYTRGRNRTLETNAR